MEAASYGLLDAEGLPPLATATAVAVRLGLDLEHHRSSSLRRGCLAEADLVLGFEQPHAVAAVKVGGAPPERVFLLLELPDLLDALTHSARSGPENVRAAIDELHRLRVAAGPRTVAPLPDPIGEPEQIVAESVRVIDAVTGTLAEALLPNRRAVSASRSAG